ncbi:LysM peptidoglycan-binding domain-containing protein [Nocardioides sp. GCM10027113]|uniref:LysM peptidoglycan-binding domain-containing protein n=1 Tax=unclassified Nocardioides TaxID=2615069 RepID=UPI00360CB0BA
MTREVTPPAPGRCLLVWLALTATTAGVLGTLLPHLRAEAASSPPAATGAGAFTDLLVLACEAALACCTLWWWLAATAVVLEARRGRTGGCHGRGLPRLLVRALVAACGVAAVSAGPLVLPAQATAPTASADRTGAGPATALTRVSLMVARPVVVVRPGDTLWRLAEQSLAAGATDAAVDRRWRRIHALNRDVIGSDPDLVRPAQRLRLPAPRPR